MAELVRHQPRFSHDGGEGQRERHSHRERGASAAAVGGGHSGSRRVREQRRGENKVRPASCSRIIPSWFLRADMRGASYYSYRDQGSEGATVSTWRAGAVVRCHPQPHAGGAVRIGAKSLTPGIFGSCCRGLHGDGGGVDGGGNGDGSGRVE